MLRRHKGYKATFVRHVERIQPQNFARRLNLLVHGHVALPNVKLSLRCFGNLDQSRGESTSREVAEAVNLNSRV